MHTVHTSPPIPQGFGAEVIDDYEFELSQLPPLFTDPSLFFEVFPERPGSDKSDVSFRGTPDPNFSDVAEAIVALNPQEIVAPEKPLPQQPSMSTELRSLLSLEKTENFQKTKKKKQKSEEKKRPTKFPQPDINRSLVKARIEAIAKAKVEAESEAVQKNMLNTHEKISLAQREYKNLAKQVNEEHVIPIRSDLNANAGLFADPLFHQLFRPETVYHYVQIAKGSKVPPAYETDIPLLRFCDVHSLPMGESIAKPCLQFKQSLLLEVQKGLLSSNRLKIILGDNLNSFFFIDEEVRGHLWTLIETFDKQDYVIELVALLENLTKQQRLNQALYIVSFLRHFFPESIFLVVLHNDYLMRKGLYRESVDSLNKILAVEPNEIYAKFIIAECLFFLGDCQAALIHISWVRSHYPLCLYTTALMSAIITGLQKKLDPALSAIIEQNPGYSYPLALRAEFYFENKHYQEAIIDYNRLLQINPQFVYAYHRYHLTLGILNANNGRV